ncbi:MAG TPA: glycosyltransferase [Verrucomicrobiae bacterium]
MSITLRIRRSLWLRFSPWLRLNWPEQKQQNSAKKIALICVNFNTAKYISYLLFSLCRIVGRDKFGEIVIVDNNSTDGSRQILRAMQDAGLITLIANERQQYHGPGLNQAMRHLASVARMNVESSPDYVLILDSDVIVLRPTLVDDLLSVAVKKSAGLTGEIEDFEYIEAGYAHISSVLIDPKQVWRRGITPFEHHGVPDLEFQRDLVRRRIFRQNFPMRSELYVLHLWNGTLRTIRDSGLRDNKFFRYASTFTDRNSEDVPQGKYVLDEFLAAFNSEVAELTPSSIVNACLRKAEINLKRPFELLEKGETIRR